MTNHIARFADRHPLVCLVLMFALFGCVGTADMEADAKAHEADVTAQVTNICHQAWPLDTTGAVQARKRACPHLEAS